MALFVVVFTIKLLVLLGMLVSVYLVAEIISRRIVAVFIKVLLLLLQLLLLLLLLLLLFLNVMVTSILWSIVRHRWMRPSEYGATAATSTKDSVASTNSISADGSANGTSPMILPFQHALLQQRKFVGSILGLKGQSSGRRRQHTGRRVQRLVAVRTMFVRSVCSVLQVRVCICIYVIVAAF